MPKTEANFYILMMLHNFTVFTVFFNKLTNMSIIEALKKSYRPKIFNSIVCKVGSKSLRPLVKMILFLHYFLV